MYATRVHESTISVLSRFVPEVCQAIIKNLKTTYLKVKVTTSRCVHQQAKVNGKKFPTNSTADGIFQIVLYFFNYKGSHSIVLLALVDARYEFSYVNVGINGRVRDGDNLLNFPPAKALPGRSMKVP
ncbi:hypothetical protein PPYR_02332 [Photinus pyralis]|uniref:Uncharacterized protein n=1 Tax=Photinus pyralis TaxID=7054 RepID=A0A5N4B6Y7_PHOPY|nr:hypothetical protein PPYR_02332 [Photinus pyralis]